MADLSPQVRRQIEEILTQKLGTIVGPFDEIDLTELTNAICRELNDKVAAGKFTLDDMVATIIAAVSAYMVYKLVRKMLRESGLLPGGMI